MAKFNYVSGKEGSYLRFEIEGGDNADCVGDVIWFSPDGAELLISDMCDHDTLEEIADLFTNKLAFINAMEDNGLL